MFIHDGPLSNAAHNSHEMSNINRLGCFEALCRRLEAAHDLDYIIVDLSPGASALAQMIVTR